LQIARRLKLPRELLRRAHRYLKRRQKRGPELIQLQKLREDAEKAREEAMAAQHRAEREAEDLRQQSARLAKEAEEASALREARLRLQPNDPVHVPKYDKQGKIVRIDHKRNVAVVNLGLGQWEVSLEEVFPLQK
jgi:DNA mismatch repair protein MutS2